MCVRNERRHVAIRIVGVRALVVLHAGVLALVRIEAMDIVALVLLMLGDVGEGHIDVHRHRRRRQRDRESLIIEVAARALILWVLALRHIPVVLLHPIVTSMSRGRIELGRKRCTGTLRIEKGGDGGDILASLGTTERKR